MAVDVVDTVVVGGGGVGSAAAWRLAARGVEVLLLERFAPGHTNGASHGASRIFRVAYPEADYVQLALRALPLWRELGSVLELTGGITHGRTANLDPLAAALAAAGTPGEWLSPAAASERWPGIRYEGRVFHHPLTGTLHADNAVAALQAAAVAHGAVVRHETPVTEIRSLSDHVEVRTAQDTYRARRVVVAGGAWSAKLLDGVVALPPLRVTQEQPAYFALDHPADWPAFSHHLAPEDGYPSGVYGLATPGFGIKAGFHGVGPECDPDHRDFRPEPTQLAALRRYAREWLPGVDPDQFTPISCTYTTTANEDFILDRVGPVVVAAGFSGHGFKFLPALGDLLADLALTDARAQPRFALS
ncbi:FAD-dependent oxidoreductase [Actinokineospora sp. NBRC 105648]|uniref:FAD-dependent oxidoreductase n=1 Tax=Actinokineospora sp. NBRC 105648 TaxID=3032206 RepID=UPI0024A30A2D|nr:FAD-dependent oxidoreductase [Actinokineospora sp. NBRC 105648]GLZ43640.1 N-methyltryptophan oxidase [Actinokineospora sp. NBRC 105648]